MKRFHLSTSVIEVETEKQALTHVSAGAYVCFEGWVRDHNEGHGVLRLDYQAYEPLAESEGENILTEAMQRFGLREARCIHRVGSLSVGDLAVWIGISADHRGAAFDACRYVIDEIKSRVPIWKNEYYANGHSGWLHPDGTPVVNDT